MRSRRLKQKTEAKPGAEGSDESIAVEAVEKAAAPPIQLEPTVPLIVIQADSAVHEEIVSTVTKVAAGEKTPPEPGAPEKPDVPKIDLSSPKAEFSLKIGSPDQARRSMVRAYLTMVVAPAVVVLACLSQLKTADTDGARSLASSLEFMLGSVLAMGIPFMAVSYAFGFYPKGSYGRLVSGSAFAALLGLLLVLVLLSSDLQGAVADYGAAVRLNWISVIVCLSSAFYFMRVAAEFLDERKAWRKRMGADVKKVRLNLKSGFVDFDWHIGKFGSGSSTAWMAYVNYLIAPTFLLVGIDYSLNEAGAEGAIISSIDSMFIAVILFALVMVPIRFARGFYPYGSKSRVTFGLACIPVMTLFAWQILMGSGIESALAENDFIIEIKILMLPALMYILFILVFEVSEFLDGRRVYRRWIGLPVEPYTPGEEYHRLNDFDLFYASFREGTKWGRRIVYKYALEIALVVIVVAALISLDRYSGDLGSLERAREAIDPVQLHAFEDSTIFVMLVLAIVNTASVFFAYSYREGSFSRLVMSGVVAIFASQWAYYFWSSLARIFSENDMDRVFYSIMFASMGIIILRMVWQLHKGFMRSRNKYINWRWAVLKKELPDIGPARAPPAPTPFRMPTGVFANDVLGIPQDPRGIALRAEVPRPQARTAVGATFSFDITSEEQSIAAKQEKK